MKTILISAIMVLTAMTAFSQNRISPPKLFERDDIGVINDATDEFILGWNGDSPGVQMDSALDVN